VKETNKKKRDCTVIKERGSIDRYGDFYNIYAHETQQKPGF
jgi:hypothetical protein